MGENIPGPGTLLARSCLALFAVFLPVLAGCATAAAEPGGDRPRVEVMVVATLHGRHAGNPRYSYDDLYRLVDAFEPDVVGVEIRPEDLGGDPGYLAQNYPLEMRTLAERHRESAIGIDWLGDELAGRAIPTGYWRERSAIKRLERELQAGGGVSSPRLAEAERRQAAILEAATPQSLNDGAYDRATRDYYAALSELLAETPYRRLSEFYSERDRRIAGNAQDAVEAALASGGPRKGIVFVVGADHRGPLVRALAERFGSAIEFVPVGRVAAGTGGAASRE